jgi:hypothetical protein
MSGITDEPFIYNKYPEIRSLGRGAPWAQSIDTLQQQQPQQQEQEQEQESYLK